MDTASLMEPTKKKARVAFDVTALKIEKTLQCGNLILPGGVESACGLISKIFIYLDLKSLLNVIESNLIKQLCLTFGSNDFKKPITIKGNVNSLGIIKCFKSIKKTITKKE